MKKPEHCSATSSPRQVIHYRVSFGSRIVRAPWGCVGLTRRTYQRVSAHLCCANEPAWRNGPHNLLACPAFAIAMGNATGQNAPVGALHLDDQHQSDLGRRGTYHIVVLNKPPCCLEVSANTYLPFISKQQIRGHKSRTSDLPPGFASAAPTPRWRSAIQKAVHGAMSIAHISSQVLSEK